MLNEMIPSYVVALQGLTIGYTIWAIAAGQNHKAISHTRGPY